MDFKNSCKIITYIWSILVINYGIIIFYRSNYFFLCLGSSENEYVHKTSRPTRQISQKSYSEDNIKEEEEEDNIKEEEEEDKVKEEKVEEKEDAEEKEEKLEIKPYVQLIKTEIQVG